MTIKTFGMSQPIPSFPSVPTIIGPKGMLINVNGVVYVSDGTKWNGPQVPAEEYIGLYTSSGSNNGVPINNVSTPNTNFLIKTGFSSTAKPLHTLSSKWNPNTLFALEATLWVSSGSYTAYAQLYDVTAGSAVANTNISSSNLNGAAVPVRSQSVTLTPGHSYCVTIWANQNLTNSMFITDVSLVALLL